ncbi:hypothetical protein I532_04175 [Brevibacillus borstelensis AK1]|uniref:Uncharacterized protein n=1 Tax=Brevibacillus borstelensis AK1 TaxID=1300222 RepID=M8DMB0_9BACL|nr:hypothetical protein I532_04175 [Brevibacillus borstelensis AK1]
MPLFFGVSFIVLAAIGKVPSTNLLCLLIAALLLIAREFITRTKISDSLLFFVVFSVVVLPLFNFWKDVNLPDVQPTVLLTMFGVVLVLTGFKTHLHRQ